MLHDRLVEVQLERVQRRRDILRVEVANLEVHVGRTPRRHAPLHVAARRHCAPASGIGDHFAAAVVSVFDFEVGSGICFSLRAVSCVRYGVIVGADTRAAIVAVVVEAVVDRRDRRFKRHSRHAHRASARFSGCRRWRCSTASS